MYDFIDTKNSYENTYNLICLYFSAKDAVILIVRTVKSDPILWLLALRPRKIKARAMEEKKVNYSFLL